MVKLFIHEVKRVFMDRMVNEEDIVLLEKYLEGSLAGDNFEKSEIDAALTEPILFTPFIYEMQ